MPASFEEGIRMDDGDLVYPGRVYWCGSVWSDRHVCGCVALKYAEASTLGPYTLLRLVIGVATGIVIFREMPNLLGVLGTVLILTSCLLAIRKKPAPRPVALAEAF